MSFQQIRHTLWLPGLVIGLVIALGLVPAAQSPATDSFDIVITGGRIVDGTGAPWFAGDLGIRDDRIAAIGNLKTARAKTRIDANGMVVAPGFIDLLGQSEFNVLVDNRAASKILQGVTTEVTGEGTSIAPLNDRVIADHTDLFRHFNIVVDWRTLGEYFKRLDERAHPAINLATFVGAGGLRTYVVGKENRTATAAELEQMKKLVAAAMEDGALGLSSALQYMPDRFAGTDELVTLASVAASYGGVYFTHQRSESAGIFASLEEVFTIAERAKIPAEIWHLKTAYRANFGKMPEVLLRIESARARGLDITADQYPYSRASNGLDACLPLWAREGGVDKMIARLKDPTQRERIKDEMMDPNAPGWENQWYGAGGSSGVMLSSVLDRSCGSTKASPSRRSASRRARTPGCGHGPGHCRPREQPRHYQHHERRRRAGGAPAPPGERGQRLARAGGGRAALGVEVASPRVGHVRADPGQVRARRTRAPAGRCGPQDDLAAGDARPPHRPRHPQARPGCRRHRLRSGEDPRRVHVRGPAALLGWCAVRCGEWAPGRIKREDHRRASGEGTPGAGLQAVAAGALGQRRKTK